MFPSFAHTVPCSRPAVPPEYDRHGNKISDGVAALTFDAVYVPPRSALGTQIIDGALRETTITKPVLYVESHPDLKSGDHLIVNGESGWEVDGTPTAYTHPWTGWQPPLVVELRRSDG
mgnify:CR=1 FL=1